MCVVNLDSGKAKCPGVKEAQVSNNPLPIFLGRKMLDLHVVIQTGERGVPAELRAVKRQHSSSLLGRSRAHT